MIDTEPSTPEAPDHLRTVAILAVSAGVTVAILVSVLSIGSWAYDHRRYSLHDGRLRRLVEQHPSWPRTEAGLRSEHGATLDAPREEDAFRRFAAGWSKARAEEIVAKRRRFPDVRVLAVRDMVYFLYVDDAGLLRDYVLVLH